MKNIALILLLLVGLTACVPPAPFDFRSSEGLTKSGSESEGNATVYVLRDIPKAGSEHPALVQFDGVEVGRVTNGSYLRVELPPGIHEVRIAWPFLWKADTKGIALKGYLAGDRTYYFLLEQENEFVSVQTMQAVTTIRQIGPRAAEPRMAIYAKSDVDPAAQGALSHAVASTAPTPSKLPLSMRATATAPTFPPANTAQTPQPSIDLSGNASQVANQLGCGDLRPAGDGTFTAQCGDHHVVIDCDGGKCRPTHTINN